MHSPQEQTNLHLLSIVDQHGFSRDPDPTFYVVPDPDPAQDSNPTLKLRKANLRCIGHNGTAERHIKEICN
jgi:hypothetical protein